MSDERTWKTWLTALRRHPEVDSGARTRLLDAIGELPPPAVPATRGSLVGRLWRDWFAPRAIRFSPAAAGAALIAVLAMGVWWGGRTPAEVPVAADLQAVQFVLVAPRADRVSVVGDFNDWDPEAAPLERGDEGLWSVVVRLNPGRHTYAFVVDDDLWLPDEHAPRAPEDEFGRANSVVLVGEGTS